MIKNQSDKNQSDKNQTLKPYKQACQLCKGLGKIKLTSVTINCPKCQSIKVESNELLILLTKEIVDLTEIITTMKNEITTIKKVTVFGTPIAF
jgi:hypothetical protein